jgi:N-acetyl-gamma-glutamyl-phosphate reductase
LLLCNIVYVLGGYAMIKLGIIGATGYVGAEVVRLLSRRSDIDITTVISNSFAGKPYSSVYPSLRGLFDKICDPPDIEAASEKADFFITALPHGVATSVIPQLLKNGRRVIDHSADYRFRDIKVYEQWYKVVHSSPDLINKAVYGLPELYRESIKKADLVADPGCYPTCSILGIAPALVNKIASPKGIIIDAASGVSGGRWPSGCRRPASRREKHRKPMRLCHHFRRHCSSGCSAIMPWMARRPSR